MSEEVERVLHPPMPRFNLPVNREKTEEVRREEAYVRYKTWLDCFGAVYGKLEFPVVFGEQGLIGVAARETIGPHEAVLHVPYSLCITYATVKESELRDMIETEEIFQETDDDWLDFALYAYLIREKVKDTESFWYPYFRTVENPEMLLDWSSAELMELQDQFLLHKALYFRDKLRKKKHVLVAVLRKYPQFYPQETDLDSLFAWAYKLLHTRSFAWGNPEGMLVPFADNLNHADLNLTYKTLEKSKIASLPESTSHLPSREKLYMNRMMKFLHQYKSVDGLKVVSFIWETEEMLGEFESSSDENSDSDVMESEDEEGEEGEEEESEESGLVYPTKAHESQYSFTIFTGEDTVFPSGHQVFNCYGRHSNATLLLYYGFCMFDNHHDSLLFKVPSSQLWNPAFEDTIASLTQSISDRETHERLGGAKIEDLAVAFKLQKNRLNEKVLSFHRGRILDELEKEPEFARKLGKLPRDEPTTEFIELSCLQRVLSVYQLLQHNRRLDAVEADKEQLETPDLPHRQRFALIYRICQSSILSNQITLIRKLTSIMRALQAKVPMSQAHLADKTMEDFYWTYPLRNYLKQLHSNRRKWESGAFFLSD